MAVNTKAIKRRMKSITNTKKITKAMEMVSAAKMRRAVDAALRTRAYAHMAKELMDQLSSVETKKMPLLATRPVERALVITIAASRGLCGSFNANIFKATGKFLVRKDIITQHDGEMTQKNADLSIDLIGIGKKTALFAKKAPVETLGIYDQFGERPTFEDILPISRMAIEQFVAKKYDKVYVAYTDYKSSIAQQPTVRQLLPITKTNIDAMLDDVGGTTHAKEVYEGIDMDQFLFEPNKQHILDTVLPRLVEVQLFQALLESVASEHSARMVAMKNANEAAGEMLWDLQLSFNKARQAAITQEISEIVGGAAALE
ncbi:MAG TPA: ATP synthase F1 subunit gamma [Candidatus Kapabacteria bacterium]|nr:ATP synthase F1 subunit gamma [Candidatus Kapabacteria bacterium]